MKKTTEVFIAVLMLTCFFLCGCAGVQSFGRGLYKGGAQAGSPGAVLIGALLGGAQPIKYKYAVVGVCADKNEVMKGLILHYPEAGEAAIGIVGEVTHMECKGKSWVTYIPPTGGCVGQQGKALLTCSDGRVINADWIGMSCTTGYGIGRDQQDNLFYFAYGMTEQEAENEVQKLRTAAASLPPLEPVYKPKETRKSKGYSTGTGFFVSADGHLVTNYHVVDEAKEFTVITTNGQRLRAKLIKGDPVNDAAILKVDLQTTPLPLSLQCAAAKGDEVFTLGYPLVTIQGQEQKATFGRVNALTGIGDDVRFVQIDVPVQPGNSGGPLIDSNGSVVGVVTATVDALATLRASGALPQNVNYAVKADYIMPLARSALGDKWKPATPASSGTGVKELIKAAESSVVLVIAE